MTTYYTRFNSFLGQFNIIEVEMIYTAKMITF